MHATPSPNLSKEKQAELLELERTLIPVLNRVRETLGKPRVIIPKPGEQWRVVKAIDQRG